MSWNQILLPALTLNWKGCRETASLMETGSTIQLEGIIVPWGGVPTIYVGRGCGRQARTLGWGRREVWVDDAIKNTRGWSHGWFHLKNNRVRAPYKESDKWFTHYPPEPWIGIWKGYSGKGVRVLTPRLRASAASVAQHTL